MGRSINTSELLKKLSEILLKSCAMKVPTKIFLIIWSNEF